MKSKRAQTLIMIVLAIIILVLGFFYYQAKGNLDSSRNDNLQLKDSIQALKADLAQSELRRAILVETNKNLSSEVFDLRQGKPASASTTSSSKVIGKEEMKVQQLIKNTEKGWEMVLENDDPKAILKYFLPEYTTNSVRINTENMPFVQRHNDTNFEVHLQKLIETHDLTLDFGEPVFYSTIVRGNIFTTSYRSNYKVYHKGELIQKNTILCYVSGEKKGDDWLIGNYNFTRYEETE